jgi:kinesin family protein 6/9
VALIKNQVSRNEAVDPSVIIERLKRENQQLKAEIAILRGTETKENLEPYEIDECKKKVQDFLESPDPSATLVLSKLNIYPQR